MVRANRLISAGNDNPRTATDSAVKLPKILHLQQQQQQQQQQQYENTPFSNDSTDVGHKCGNVRSTVNTTLISPVLAAKKQTKREPIAVAAKVRPLRTFEKKTAPIQQTTSRPPLVSNRIEEVPLQDFGPSLAASFSDYTSSSCANLNKYSSCDNPNRETVTSSITSLLDRVMDKLEKDRVPHMDTSLIRESSRHVPQSIDQKSIAIYAAIVALCFLTLIMLGIAAFMVFIR